MNNSTTQATNPAQLWSSIPDTERELLAMRWYNSTVRLYNKTTGKMREALDSDICLIDAYGGIATPIANTEGRWGLRLLTASNKENAFYLVPLIRSDAELHPYFAEKIQRPTYQEASRAIFLPPDRMGPLWRCLVLHHEISHWEYHRQELHRDKDTGHWIEEYEIYQEEITLARNMHGNAYKNFVDQLSVLFEKELRAGSLLVKESAAITRSELDRITGTSYSSLERGIRRSIIILDALYRALNRIHVDGDKSEHHAVTEWFCDDNKAIAC